MPTPTLNDATWADPAWQMDSTTRQCCGGVGDHSAECIVPAELATVAPPADARQVDDWRDDLGTGEYERFFRSTRRSAAGVTVVVTGIRASDGAARRDAYFFAADVHLDAAALRKVATMALEAGDDLDFADYAQRTAACLQFDDVGRVSSGITKDGAPTRLPLLDVAHGRVQDALDSYPSNSWSPSETASVATFLRTLSGSDKNGCSV